jgi:hypothetical protein
MKIQCKVCKIVYEIDESKVQEEYIQCPNPQCQTISKNPLRGEND